MTAFYFIGAFWLLLALLDLLLKRARSVSRKYERFLDRYGLSVSLGRIVWETTKANSLFYPFSRNFLTFQRIWFTCGVYIALVLMPIGLLVITYTLVLPFLSQSGEETVLVPVLPGVTLPWNQIFYFLFALGLSVIVHEAGHAISAAKIDGIGVFFFLLYPGAYVNLHTEHVTMLPLVGQLRIFCAGIWHNLLLVLAALAFLYFLPWLLIPMCRPLDNGVLVAHVAESSPLIDKLVVGMKIDRVDDCQVGNRREWAFCLEKIMSQDARGFCAERLDVETQDHSIGVITNHAGVTECCENSSLFDFCFSVSVHPKKSACLHARKFTDASHCDDPSDCQGDDPVCLTPHLDSSSRLFRLANNPHPDIVYVGSPSLLDQTMLLTDCQPVLSWNALYRLPNALEAFLTYLISLSSALALLNAVPAYFLDGQWILCAAIEHFLSRAIPCADTRRRLCSYGLLGGTALLLFTVLLAIKRALVLA
ncbi:membrane-bound transcription factor site-2 protease-like isoform X2 [Oscarella lobularis]|uniref:membrane-bound transcription factor site-2 protease-like isoform X2 n=1 Tax=Oscarella lobularis TaxID=121494 RepID=UPI0033134C17